MKTLFNPKQQVFSVIATGLVVMLHLGQARVACADSRLELADLIHDVALKNPQPPVETVSQQKQLLDQQTLDELDYGDDDDCDDLDE